MCGATCATCCKHTCGNLTALCMQAMHCLSLQACRIAKLFAKHIKMPEQQQHLDSHAVGIGCGTPNRLLKLADIDALKLDRLRLLVLDVQLDAKQRWTFLHSRPHQICTTQAPEIGIRCCVDAGPAATACAGCAAYCKAG